MFINAFWVGVGATLLIEFLILIILVGVTLKKGDIDD